MDDKLTIEDIIIVEGKDDVTAVKNAINATVLPIHGYSSLSKKNLEKIKLLIKDKNVIILTDPDFAGKKIRNALSQIIPQAKHAFIDRSKATKKNNIGVENASKESIIQALQSFNLKQNTKIKKETITLDDLIEYKLIGNKNARMFREQLGDALSIGYYNAKQLLKILNAFDISKDEFQKTMNQIISKNKK